VGQAFTVLLKIFGALPFLGIMIGVILGGLIGPGMALDMFLIET